MQLLCFSETWTDALLQEDGFSGLACIKNVDSRAGSVAIYVKNEFEGDAKQTPSETGKEEETAPEDRHEDRYMKGQHPSSRESATLQGYRAPARDVDAHRNKKYLVAPGDGLFLQYASSAEDELQKPSTDAICSATRRSAGQLADTSPLPLRTPDLYDRLLRYVLSPQQRECCGYPRLCPDKAGRVLFMQGGEEAYSSHKTCSRCRASFVITHSGEYYANSACFFHTGRCSAIGFSCCGAPADHPGCNSSYYHVCPLGARDKWDTAALAFVCSRRRHGGAREVFALDCEMCFTIRGFEVARVSVVDCNGTTVYDSYVKPGSPVLDYNTAFSGITAAHLRNVHTTLQDVQGALLRLIHASTVLVGHGLENDLRVLRMVHDRVVDTAVVFPHHCGLPYRRSLRSLVGEYLNHVVPNGPLGHDSVEDAKACMELMVWKAARDQEVRDRLNLWSGGRQRQPSE
ncbi:exonuclease GOR-like [Haemaphysalis longicornis]